MPIQQPIDHRGLDAAAKLFFQSHLQGRDHHQLALLGLGFPSRQKVLLFLPLQECPPPPAPLSGSRLRGFFAMPKPALEPSHRRPPYAHRFGGYLQGHLRQGRQQNRLGHAQLLDVVGARGHQLSFLH
jgi:hypothetical protein